MARGPAGVSAAESARSWGLTFCAAASPLVGTVVCSVSSLERRLLQIYFEFVLSI